MSEEVRDWIAGTLLVVFIIAVIIGGIFGLLTVGKSFGRSQARADAKNRVQIAHIYIQKAHEEALINYAEIEATKAAAKKRVAEAEGLAAAQKLIDNTLTPLYIQHEAIQAQEQIATSGQNNTVIYVPAGTNGTPIITQPATAGKR
jgi:hypothetical protein